MNNKKSSFVTIEWKDGKVVMLDQRLLPAEEIYNHYQDVEGVVFVAVHAVYNNPIQQGLEHASNHPGRRPRKPPGAA